MKKISLLLSKIKAYITQPLRKDNELSDNTLCNSEEKEILKSKQKGRKPVLGRLDRYIITKFISTYLFLIAIIIIISVIFDFNENIDKLTQSHASASKIVQYYVNFVPYFINLFSPLFVFIAVIFFTSK